MVVGLCKRGPIKSKLKNKIGTNKNTNNKIENYASHATPEEVLVNWSSLGRGGGEGLNGNLPMISETLGF